MDRNTNELSLPPALRDCYYRVPDKLLSPSRACCLTSQLVVAMRLQSRVQKSADVKLETAACHYVSAQHSDTGYNPRILAHNMGK